MTSLFQLFRSAESQHRVCMWVIRKDYNCEGQIASGYVKDLILLLLSMTKAMFTCLGDGTL